MVIEGMLLTWRNKEDVNVEGEYIYPQHSIRGTI